MNEIYSILLMPFFVMSLVAGVIVAFLGSYYGVFVVQRRMSFLGDGLAHAAFGGVALGLLLNSEPLWTALPVTIAVSILITLLKDRTKLEMDTSIGIFFAVSMALGVIFISLKRDYSVDAFSYLFGSILLVQKADLAAALSLAVITVIMSARYWKRWAYSTFDSELAAADRHSIKFDDYVLSVMIAVTIVLSIKIVGIVLIASFLVIPAASARLISNRFYTMTVNSIIIGIAATVAGMFMSLIFDLPTGAVIILTQALVFFAIVIITYKSKH